LGLARYICIYSVTDDVDIDYSDDNGPLLIVSSLHFNTTFANDNKIVLARGVTYRFTVHTGAGRPVSIGTTPYLSSDAAPAESIRSASDSGVTNGPILLTVDESTPECMYLGSPRTRAVVLAIDGAEECQCYDATGWNPHLNLPQRRYWHTPLFFTSRFLFWHWSDCILYGFSKRRSVCF
jgi:hypothetical protein